MNERVIATGLVATALALLLMGWQATETTGAEIIGAAPVTPIVDPGPLQRWLSSPADVPPLEKQPDWWTVSGKSSGVVALVPTMNQETLAMAAAAVERERAFRGDREHTLRVMPHGLPEPPPLSEGQARLTEWRRQLPRAVVLLHGDPLLPGGTLAAGVVGGGRATAPWLRRALHVAARQVNATLAPQAGWDEFEARAGVVDVPALAPYLQQGVPAIALRVGLGSDPNARELTTALAVLYVLVDQLQTEPALPELGPDQFGYTPTKYLTGNATAWLWVFPLLPLTLATGGRYAGIAAQPEFGPAVLQAVRATIWWCVPPVGAAALLVALRAERGQPLSAALAGIWFVGVIALILFARGAYHRRRHDEAAKLGGALVLDLLWSTYAVTLFLRPWGAGAWLAGPALAWPWVAPSPTRAGKLGALVALLAGAAPAAYWLLRIPVMNDARVLTVLGWLAGSGAKPWAVLLGSIAVAAGLRLIWLALRRPVVLEIRPPHGTERFL